MIQRFQLYFPIDLYLRLKDAAARHGTSIADFVRRASERALSEETSPKQDPLDLIVGKCRSKDTDGSYNHDQYLYGMVKDEPVVKKQRKR